ncbi:MAG: hypothetical protein HY815_03915 [Candidatus Riflebacteria bacterium]|nr:hypothetical protein [Candidatus Riflebacteria bacterium]
MSRRAVGLVEILVAMGLMCAVVIPLVMLIQRNAALGAGQQFRMLALARASLILEGMLVTDHRELRRARTLGADGVEASAHPIAARILAAAARTVVSSADQERALKSQLSFYQERVAIQPVGRGDSDDLLELSAVVLWRTPVDGSPAPHRLGLTALFARPDLTVTR